MSHCRSYITTQQQLRHTFLSVFNTFVSSYVRHWLVLKDKIYANGQITRIKYGAPCTTRTCDPRFRKWMSDSQVLN